MCLAVFDPPRPFPEGIADLEHYRDTLEEQFPGLPQEMLDNERSLANYILEIRRQKAAKAEESR